MAGTREPATKGREVSLRSVSPTRSGLVRANAQLERVQKGRELLNRKREALIVELFNSAKPALDARRHVEEAAAEAYRSLLEALSVHGETSLRAYGWPKRQIELELEHHQVWGVQVPSVVSHTPIRRTLTMRGTAGAAVGPAAALAATEFERLIALVVDSLPKEQLVRRLGEALHRATRQANMLQQHVEPALIGELRALRRLLEERERDERSRLRHVLRRRRSSR